MRASDVTTYEEVSTNTTCSQILMTLPIERSFFEVETALEPTPRSTQNCPAYDRLAFCLHRTELDLSVNQRRTSESGPRQETREAQIRQPMKYGSLSDAGLNLALTPHRHQVICNVVGG